jgi:hypothetical protein
MTAIGFSVINPRRAVIWADSEVYSEAEPSSQANKFAVNALGFVGAGTGPLGLVYAAADVVHRATEVDEAAIALPPALRRARAEALAGPVARSAVTGATYALIGHSAGMGRVVGYLFSAADDFCPALARAWCSPAIGMRADEVDDEWSALAAAQAQLVEVRRIMPAATGGMVILAEIDGTRISARPVFDLTTGRRTG